MNDQSHVLCELWLGNRQIPSAVLWTTDAAPSGTAVIFVHGFIGSAVETWEEFDSLAPLEAKLRHHDVFFYGYDALRTHASESGDQFHTFLDELLTDPRTIFRFALPPAMARAEAFRYSKAVIVAHSLGTVVTRFALLTEFNRRRPGSWLPAVTPLFFAPAHSGTRKVDAVISALTSFDFAGLGLAVSLARDRYVAADDLREGSQILQDLRTEVSSISHPDRALVQPKAVVWAANDRIVINRAFLDDPKPITIRGASHTSVCKPTTRFRDPLQIVLQYI